MRILVFLLWTALAVCCAEPLLAAERLRIVTFNGELLAAPGTHKSRLERYRWDHARRRHFERVAALIETLDPDVLNLLEVTSVEAVDLLVETLHAKGMTDYQGYHVESADNFTGMDIALISKIKPTPVDGAAIRRMASAAGDMAWRENFSYVDFDGEPQTRAVLLDRHAVYLLDVGPHKLGFLGLHLKSNPEDDYSNGKRTAESLIAQRIINQEIVARGYTPIVLGDLNDYDRDVPDRDLERESVTDVLANLKQYQADGATPQLVNAAERIVRQEDRWTSMWDRNENGVIEDYDVRTMIDHILLHRSLMPRVKRVFISHATDLLVSDHQAVVVDLEF